MSARRLHAVLAAVAVLVVGGAIAFAARRPRPATIVQPIVFSHSKHLVGEHSPKLACTECHTGAERQAVAGLPSLDRCLQCHMKPQSDRPEEHVVRDVAARGGPFAWTQVTRNPGNVYFSHAAHTTIAKLTCTGCHGDVASWTMPPGQPDLRLENMGVCVDCHRERAAPTACLTCHK
jgi:hypothetical protein